jgi:hypothetical protein
MTNDISAELLNRLIELARDKNLPFLMTETTISVGDVRYDFTYSKCTTNMLMNACICIEARHLQLDK